MNRILLLSLVALALAPTVSAIAPGAISIVNYAYQDASSGLAITVANAGDVTWTDVQGVHTVTATDGSFDSGALAAGDTFTLTLGTGAYLYSCVFHANMRGTLVVV